MTEFANAGLSAWETFYVIVGSSGAALIGIQFVVITLIATRRKRPSRYVIFPGFAYAAVVVAALLLLGTTRLAVFTIAAAALALLLVGIRNSWDTVTHVVLTSGD